MTKRRWIFAILIVAGVVASAVASLKPRPEPPIDIETARAVQMTITRTVRGAGRLVPRDKVNVSSNITGVLVDLQASIGQVVKKGAYLGQIETSRYAAQVKQMRARLRAAESDIRREEANLGRLRNVMQRIDKVPGRTFNVGERERAQTEVRVSEAQLEAARSQARLAQATLQEAQTALGWATLKAPVDGTVLSLNHRVGERIRGSDFSEDVVLVLGSMSAMDAKIEVGEHDVVHLRTGQKARVEVDALPQINITGEVTDISRDAVVKNAGTDNEVIHYPVWVALDKPPAQVLAGMSAQVSIETETHHKVVAVPIQAVTVRPREAKDGGPAAAPAGRPADKLEKVVFVVDGGKAHRRKVKTGIASESHLEILEGLRAGQEVVEGPYRVLARELHDGTAVKVEEPEKSKKPRSAGAKGK